MCAVLTLNVRISRRAPAHAPFRPSPSLPEQPPSSDEREGRKSARRTAAMEMKGAAAAAAAAGWDGRMQQVNQKQGPYTSEIYQVKGYEELMQLWT
eukprot:scaffold32291_cov14-Tisochrysis_lutea.AAC.2